MAITTEERLAKELAAEGFEAWEIEDAVEAMLEAEAELEAEAYYEGMGF